MLKTLVFWKIYFWFLLVIVGALFGGSLVLGLDMIRILDFPISLTSLAGLFGYAYQKGIGVSLFWKAWLPVVVLWDLSTNFLWNGLMGFHGLDRLEVIAVIAVFYAIFAGEYLALYLYGFRSQKIWRKA
jgi:hypothetical protein